MRILIVEDDDELREAIALAMQSWPSLKTDGAGEVLTAATAHDGIALLERDPQLVLVDVRLGEDSGLRVVEAAGQRSLRPCVLAMSGKASAEEAFGLGQLGVRGYLEKPFKLHELHDLVEQAVSDAPPVESLASAHVGVTPILAVQDQLKKAMLVQALALTDWNYVRTAELLGVTRQAVQQMVRRYELRR